MKKNKFKPSLIHPIKRHQYKKRVTKAGEAWTNITLSMNKLAAQLSKALTPLEDVLENIDKKTAKSSRPNLPECIIEDCGYMAKWCEPGHSALFEGLKLCNKHYNDAIKSTAETTTEQSNDSTIL